jgi:voltage-gated potassium channel
VIAVSVAGYRLLGGPSVSFLQALYMAIITLAGVGYGEIVDTSTSPVLRVFNIFVVLVGVTLTVYVFSAVTAFLVEGELTNFFWRRKMQKRISELKNHYVICGYGRIGSIVAAEFTRQKMPFVIVDRDPARVLQANQHGHLAVEGDASREDTLKPLGIERARGLVAAVGTDAENVYAVLTARVMKSDLVHHARAEGEESVSEAEEGRRRPRISPHKIGAVQIAQTALRPGVVDFVEIATSSDNLELSIEEIRVEEKSTGRTPAGRGHQRDKMNVVVVGIQHAHGRMEFNPRETPCFTPDLSSCSAARRC